MPAPATIEELDFLMTRPTGDIMRALKSHPGTIAVLGAGGKMGFHLTLLLNRCLNLMQRKDRLIAVSRFGDEAARQPFAEHGIETISADLTKQDQVDSLPDVDNVFFMAGVKFGANDPEILQKMNIELPNRVAERYAKSRIVALSTGCVYSFTTPESGGSSEEDETDPPGDYACSCLGREEAFRRVSKKHGTPVALVRLNYSIDLRYGVLVDIAQKVLEGRPVNLETGYVNVIWQGDAVAHIVRCLTVAESPPRVINITGPCVLKVRDLAEQFGAQMGKRVTFEGTEAPTAWLNDASRSHALFGLPETGLDQMVEMIGDWLMKGRATLNKPTHFESRSGEF